MSTQTGIRANDALADFFGKCRSGRYRDRTPKSRFKENYIINNYDNRLDSLLFTLM